MNHSFADYIAQLGAFMERSIQKPDPAQDEISFNQLALALFALQFDQVTPFQQLCLTRQRTPQTVTHWHQIPPVPTQAFKDLEMSSLPEAERTRVFHSSGTTEQRPSRHFHNASSLALYEASLLPWFQKQFLADWDDLYEEELVGPLEQLGLLILTPSPVQAPHSSLVHMFDTVRQQIGSRDSFFGGRVEDQGTWTLDLDQVLFGLRKSMCANRPVGLLGTAFSFVHLLDYFAEHNMRYRLAKGSRVLETGGYKGRSRELSKAELHGLITKHLGIPASHIVCEYGMSELSSQAYTGTLVPSGETASEPGVLHFPPWARARLISPETGREVGEGETGLIQLFDLANARSVLALQTEDLGIRRGRGFILLGRAQVAEARGCSLMSP